jgi:hypothetical protein
MKRKSPARMAKLRRQKNKKALGKKYEDPSPKTDKAIC